MSASKYIPKKGVFETTLACNLNCLHCGSSAGKARKDELTTKECEDLFGQLANLGMKWLTISGGEPMTRPDWSELIALARNAGFRVGMITNAMSLDVDAAKEAKKSGLNGIGFSVDGLERTHDKIRGRIGHFNKLMEAMENCREASLPFSVITTLNNENLPQLEQLRQLIIDKGAYAWQVQLGSDMGNMRKNSHMLIKPEKIPHVEQQIAQMIRKGSFRIHPGDSLGYFGPFEKILRSCTGGTGFGGCGAGISNIGIESNGNIKGCLSMMPGYNQESDDWVEGNIRKNTLEEIWNRPGAFAYTRQWKLEDLEGFCTECKHVQRCKGGCIAKRISDGNIKENSSCSYKILKENEKESKIAYQAAAALLAGFMTVGTAACDNADEQEPNDTDTSADTDTTNDTATASDDTSSTDTYVAAPVYGMPVDTADTADTSDDTGIMPPYSMPTDTDPVSWYGMPTDMDTETDTTTDTASDTENIMPPYSMPPDTDSEGTPIYMAPELPEDYEEE